MIAAVNLVSPLSHIPRHVVSNVVIGVIPPLDCGGQEVTCTVNGKRVQLAPFSMDLVRKIFQKGTKVLFPYDGGYRLPSANVVNYTRIARGHNRPADLYINLEQRKDEVTSDKRIKICTEKRKSSTQLFEVNVPGDLYTYILAFSNGTYIRTPLIKKINLD